MSRPIIGVTTHLIETDDPHPGTFLRINEAYMQGIRVAGGVPVHLAGHEEAEEELLKCLDGLLLTGGGDLDPALYGEPNRGTMPWDERRDRYELSLLRGMVRRGKPVLGICRGIQVINVGLGGTLWQDVDSQLGLSHPSGHGIRHGVRFAPDCFLLPALAQTTLINSTHHQAVKDVAPGLVATAWSDDGLIEAIQAADGRPIWGVQFHPERLVPGRPEMVAFFRTVVAACGN